MTRTIEKFQDPNPRIQIRRTKFQNTKSVSIEIWTLIFGAFFGA
jgi:hypothetical protein